MTKRVGENAFALLILALTAAVLLSLYLSVHHAQLATDQVRAGSSLCSFSAELDCDSVLLTAQALTFGIPNSLYALVLYSNLLLFGIFAWYLQGNVWRWYVRIGLLADFAAVGVSSYFAYVLFTRMPSKCLFCTALQACSVLALVAYIGLLRSARETTARPREWALAGLLVLLCLMLAPVEYLSVEHFYVQGEFMALERENAANSRILRDPNYNFYLYNKSPQVTIRLDEETPLRGAPDSKHTLVMFTDFECGPCSRFHRTCIEGVRALPGRVKVYFKHFPLGKACNPSAINPNYHPLSCTASYAAEAARMQGKFWDYADLLFERRNEIDEEGFISLAEELRLDVDKFRKDISSEEVRKRVEADITLGNSLRLTGTPAVFLDGRELLGNEPRAMFWSLIHALDAAPASLMSGTQFMTPLAPTSATPEITPATGEPVQR